ncbi:putative galactose oxidase precursor [Paramyrothecium foliicola]|nr:putative galactose oxidase precursor [Paramyrothecium foliicola]
MYSRMRRTRRPASLIVISAVALLWTLTQLPWHSSLVSLVSFRSVLSRTSRVGQWGPLIPVPLVPAAAAVLPRSRRIVLLAANGRNTFTFAARNTITAVVDLATGLVVSRNLTQPDHGMFCPGLSMSSDGRVFVTGGTVPEKTTIFNDDIDDWVAEPDMKIPRGYHSQATLADGRIFVIGGSWSGGIGGKNGEIFSAVENNWTALPACSVLPMFTNDKRGILAADNHAWLFSWSNNSVFQAGPSSAMNWYGPDTPVCTVPAGSRGDDLDSMNGNAVFYDALHGKILTLGGSSSYISAPATRAAHIITLGEAFARPTVERLDDMHSARVFANSVVLPSGEVFISGGASWARQWTDVNASWVPEMWSPQTHKFTEMATMPVPRTYHSFAVLLPDATVLVGGGGICFEKCVDYSINHENIQVFRPPYLFDRRGRKFAQRPEIKTVSKESLLPGDEFVVGTDLEFVDLVLIRYASVTHSINTDQRRIKLRHEAMPWVEGVNAENLSIWNHSTVLPSDPGILVPGYWMLFAVDVRGTPSIAANIVVEAPKPP